MANILIIDDDMRVSDTLANMVMQTGHEPTCVHKLRDGLKAANSQPFDIVFLDVIMPEGSGLDILSKVCESQSKPEVIVMTALGNPEGAETAIKNGAWDYITKPFSIKELQLQLLRAIQYRRGKMAGKKIPFILNRKNIIGSSPKINACIDLLGQAADSDASVLINGATGTGKELFAYAIHENSPRASKNFVVVDCTTLPHNLLESLLFGHEKGTFTGADKKQDGLISQAHGGTLFLDEIGELPFSFQKAFLRVLQEHRFRPLGSKLEEICDFRVITATNRDLGEMVKQGQFREDLLFRLQSMTISLPLLKERRKDIKDLAMHCITRLCKRYEIGIKKLSPEFIESFMAYDWPGNVRELFNTLDMALAVARHEPTLFPIHLPCHIRVSMARKLLENEHVRNDTAKNHLIFSGALPNMRDFRENLEKEYLQNLIQFTKGDIKDACKISGIARSSLYDYLRKYNISTNVQ